jgi:sugar phosphate isomerase/epimerase
MKYLLCGGGLYPLPARMILDLAKKAGFDGAEIFLFGHWTSLEILNLREYAAEENLEVHFHQMWSKEESSDSAAATINKVLSLLGQIPADGYHLSEVVPGNANSTVIYANYYNQMVSGMWVQTLSTGFGAPRLPYSKFVEAFRQNGFPIVFDTTHFLEYASGKHGVSQLRGVDALTLWQDGLDIFGHKVKEIHFNDYDPFLGDARGRNLLPGTGIARLHDLVSVLRYRKWDGYIVPEFRWDLVKWNSRRLLELRKSMDEYFGE